MSSLDYSLRYSTGEIQVLQLIFLAVLVPWINHLPPVCWFTFGNLIWKDSGIVCIMENNFFIVFNFVCTYVRSYILIFRNIIILYSEYLIFASQIVLHFLQSTLVLSFYMDVVVLLSICQPLYWIHFANIIAQYIVHFMPSLWMFVTSGYRFRSIRPPTWASISTYHYYIDMAQDRAIGQIQPFANVTCQKTYVATLWRWELWTLNKGFGRKSIFGRVRNMNITLK